MFMAFLCPEISKIKNAKKISLSNLANYLLNITHFYDHKSYFIRTTFRLVIIRTIWHLFSNFEIKRSKKCVIGIFYPSLKKFQKCTLKNENFENQSPIYKFYVDLGPKRYLGPRHPIIGSMGYGVGGLNKKFRVRTLIP